MNAVINAVNDNDNTVNFTSITDQQSRRRVSELW